PGATKRLGAKMALRGLAASQPRMRADTHDGPEQVAPLQRPDTLMQLSRSLISESPSCTARPGHTFWLKADMPVVSLDIRPLSGAKRTSARELTTVTVQQEELTAIQLALPPSACGPRSGWPQQPRGPQWPP